MPLSNAGGVSATPLEANNIVSSLILFDQKVHWHAQRAGEFLLQFGGPFASASFDLGQVVLADADRYGQLALNHVAPFADDTHRVIAVCESISHGFWQHDFAAFLEGTRGTADDPARGGIFLRLGGEGYQPIIFDARQYGEIVAAGSADELDLAFYGAGFCHGVLLVVNIAAVSNRVNSDGVGFDREQDAPNTGAQPHSGCTFERFHIADAGFRKRLQFEIDLCPRSSGKFAPLADSG